MSLTLGQKLREAREERGISITEVSEQTRISPHYIESIENDNYKPLPGGIFNKGFVRSYAKYVGIDENEALQDYSRLAASIESEQAASQRSYRPEVLTDDRPGVSILPTILIACVILGFMAGGILFVLRYLNGPDTPQTATNPPANTANVQTPDSEANPQPAAASPALEASKVEFRAVGQPVWLRAVVDGKSSETLVDGNKAASFEPKQSLKLSYSRSRAQFASLSINGKEIALPAEPVGGNKGTIDVEINRDNFGAIWQESKAGAGTSAVVREMPPANRPAPVRPRPSPTAGVVQPKPSPPKPANLARPTPR